MSWFDSDSYCRSYGGELASILTEEDAYNVRELITDVAEITWIGANDFEFEG